MTEPRGPAQSVRRRGRRRHLTMSAAASTVLVASFLVVNCTLAASAAPSPLRSSAAGSLYAPDLVARSGNFFDAVARLAPAPAFSHDKGANAAAVLQSRDRLFADAADERGGTKRDVASDFLRQQEMDRRASPLSGVNVKRAATNSTNAASTRSVNSASFTSNLANAWNPGTRSIWFQRKAVIITSIFLAIFIVLIIGCVVFLRGKREDDLDEEYDVSDEAALARMRDEREMRLGSRAEKKSKRRRRNDDSSSMRRESSGSTTAIAASKWCRIPTRKVRVRKSRSNESSIGDEKAVVGATPPASSDANHTQQSAASFSASDEGVLASQTSMERSASDQQSPHNATSSLGDAPPSHSASSQAGSQAGPSRLNAADFAAAEEEEERLRMSEALPPAYISGHQRRASAAAQALHPTADRQLAGQQSQLFVEARGDVKQAEGIAELQAARGPRSPVHVANAPHVGPSTPATDTVGMYAGHLATDDKSTLSQMRAAASRPDEFAPIYSSSAPTNVGGASDSSMLATAPEMSDEPYTDAPPPLDALSTVNAPYVSEKGKAVTREGSYSSRLPVPPSQPVHVTFSPFDLPYDSIGRSSLSDTLQQHAPSAPPLISISSRGKEKEREAAEEGALALLASQPEDLRNLPRYEHAGIAPSAPTFEEDVGVDVESAHGVLSQHTVSAPPSAPSGEDVDAPSAPSAPPL